MHPKSTARGITTGLFTTSLVTNLVKKRQKNLAKLSVFISNLFSRINDLLRFAIGVCLDFHFCVGGGKIF